MAIFNCKAIFRFWLLATLGFFVGPIMAHEDMDLALTSVRFDEQCHPKIKIKNTGERPLPTIFYLAVNPAFITLKKPSIDPGQSDILITSKSLRALDPKKQLLPVGGELEITINQKIANNPHPITAQLHSQGEFWEYNQANDTIFSPIDCIPGKGQIAGNTTKPSTADLSLLPIRIAPHSCEVELTLMNSNQGPLQNTAWDGDAGIILSIYDIQNQVRLPAINLLQIDPQHLLAAGSVKYKATPGAGHFRYSLWQVKDDPDFSNNHQEISLDACAK